jgi:hypothetical protein
VRHYAYHIFLGMSRRHRSPRWSYHCSLIRLSRSLAQRVLFMFISAECPLHFCAERAQKVLVLWRCLCRVAQALLVVLTLAFGANRVAMACVAGGACGACVRSCVACIQHFRAGCLSCPLLSQARTDSHTRWCATRTHACSMQLRNIHRMQVIESYANGEYKNHFNTFLDFKPRGG